MGVDKLQLIALGTNAFIVYIIHIKMYSIHHLNHLYYCSFISVCMYIYIYIYIYIWLLHVFGATGLRSSQCKQETSRNQVGLVILAAGSEAKKRDRRKETRDQRHRLRRLRHTANLSCRSNAPLTNIHKYIQIPHV